MSARVRGRHAHRRTGRDASREAEIVPLMEDRAAHTETSPRLTGGDVDADWHAAWDAGDEAVGGSVATPDQSVVDELGEALGVAQAPDAEVVASGEILAERDSHRWQAEREAARDDEVEWRGARAPRRRRAS